MPELPEVETVVRDLEPHLQGRRITTIRKVSRKRLRRPWRAQWEKLLSGRRIEFLTRRGKWIALIMEGSGDDRLYLLIHLGMTGQLTVVAAEEPLASHTHLVLTLEGGEQQLRFRDIRRFGSATVISYAEWRQLMESGKIGPEPFATDLKYWQSCLSGTRRCLKAILLDQQVIAGVGNIYADESLFEAGLHPTQLGCDVDTHEADRLRKAIRTVLKRAIQRRGSSIQNYVGGSGLKGEYQNEFRVYGRTGEPCPRCKTSIECIRLAGRSTHYCPECQKVPYV